MMLPSYMQDPNLPRPSKFLTQDTEQLSYWFRPESSSMVGSNPNTLGLYGTGLYLYRSDVKADYYAEFFGKDVVVYAVNLDLPLMSTQDSDFKDVAESVCKTLGVEFSSMSQDHPLSANFAHLVQKEIEAQGYRGVFDDATSMLVVYNPKKDAIAMGKRKIQDCPIYSENLRAEAVAALVTLGDKFLLLKRGVESPYAPKIWELPGGIVAEGDSSFQAIVHYLKEQLNIEIPIIYVDFLSTYEFGSLDVKIYKVSLDSTRTPLKQLSKSAYVNTRKIPKDAQLGHSAYEDLAWASLEDLAKYTLTPLAEGVFDTFSNYQTSQ